MESHRRDFQNRVEQTVPFFVKRNRVEPAVEKDLKKSELILSPVNLPVPVTVERPTQVQSTIINV